MQETKQQDIRVHGKEPLDPGQVLYDLYLIFKQLAQTKSDEEKIVHPKNPA